MNVTEWDEGNLVNNFILPIQIVYNCGFNDCVMCRLIQGCKNIFCSAATN